jgi:hypothetical protein
MTNVQRYEIREHIIGLDHMSMVDIVVRFRFANWRCDERELWRRAGLLQFLRRHMKPAVETARFPSSCPCGFGPQLEMLPNTPVDARRSQPVQRKLFAPLKVM